MIASVYVCMYVCGWHKQQGMLNGFLFIHGKGVNNECLCACACVYIDRCIDMDIYTHEPRSGTAAAVPVQGLGQYSLHATPPHKGGTMEDAKPIWVEGLRFRI